MYKCIFIPVHFLIKPVYYITEENMIFRWFFGPWDSKRNTPILLPSYSLHQYHHKKIIIKKSSYDIFLTLLLFLFGFNPLVSQSLYYTAESIFEEIKAIKGFIYLYLEQTPWKLYSIIQIRTLSTDSLWKVAGPVSWQDFLLIFVY